MPWHQISIIQHCRVGRLFYEKVVDPLPCWVGLKNRESLRERECSAVRSPLPHVKVLMMMAMVIHDDGGYIDVDREVAAHSTPASLLLCTVVLFLLTTETGSYLVARADAVQVAERLLRRDARDDLAATLVSRNVVLMVAALVVFRNVLRLVGFVEKWLRQDGELPRDLSQM